MKRRIFFAGGAASLVLSACAPPQPETTMQNDTAEIAPGRNRDFSFTVETNAPDRVWHLWTTPSTWGQWDRGLQSARLDGQMALGSQGEITPLSGPNSTFTVVAFDPKQSYAFETRLPAATLRIDRSFNDTRTAFTHRVTFRGLAAAPFALMFGPGFRQALPPTMRTLASLAEQA